MSGETKICPILSTIQVVTTDTKGMVVPDIDRTAVLQASQAALGGIKGFKFLSDASNKTVPLTAPCAKTGCVAWSEKYGGCGALDVEVKARAIADAIMAAQAELAEDSVEEPISG